MEMEESFPTWAQIYDLVGPLGHLGGRLLFLTSKVLEWQDHRNVCDWMSGMLHWGHWLPFTVLQG